jgi:hypothetical protein
LSFDNVPIATMEVSKRQQSLLLVQDLDNFIFQNDVIVVVAAGNTEQGVRPTSAYPNHFDDPQWELGAWARSFNSLTCGSFVGRLHPDGLVKQIGWPSAFTRVGPGLCGSPKPDFSEHGGNSTELYRYGPGLGVWGLNSRGQWEDRSGTSFATPVLARQAAFAFQELQKACDQGARPFAVTVKAYLALTAAPPIMSPAIGKLVERTLGMGTASADRLRKPSPESAVLLWQGILEGPNDVARIQLPIPRHWLRNAAQPHMRLVVAWDPPANAAVKDLWTCRRVIPYLRSHPEARALRASAGGHESYPLIDRRYDLRRLPSGVKIDGDIWLLELSYAETADYYPAIDFSPQQRVTFAAELIDTGEKQFSPQAALQQLEIVDTMIRLSVPPEVIRVPIILKTGKR